MESSSQEQNPQEPQQQVWRGEVPTPESNPEAKRRSIIDKIRTVFPKNNMNAKANMLNDLLSRFKPPTDDEDNNCEGHIKDIFHFVRRNEIKRRRYTKILSKKNMVHLAKVRDLVTQMNSPRFGIQPDPFSFHFDKTKPIKPQATISEENSQDRPEMSETFESCSIDSDPPT